MAQDAAASQPAMATNDIRLILDRLERIEQENRNLAAEVHALREQLEAGGRAVPQVTTTEVSPQAQLSVPPSSLPPPSVPPLDERVSTTEQRVEEMAQSKVEASQKFPLKLTGTLLFNSYLNGRANGGDQYPTVADSADNRNAGGASITQSIIGFLWNGPRIWGGGKVNGSLNLDLSGRPANPVNHLMRLHIANLSIDWKNQSLTVGQDKPIFSPREPTSLAQVAVSPLTGTGNPWLWQPQIRFEQRFAVGENSGLRAQAGMYQTAEPTGNAGTAYSNSVASSRPALEGRFNLWHGFSQNARVEVAPGFHVSQTHVAGTSVASRLVSVDWMIQPLRKVQVTGLYYQGSNGGGLGGLRQGFALRYSNSYTADFVAIHTAGGWAQFSYQPTSRLSFDLYGGQESYPTRELAQGMISRNLAYAGNAIFRLAPNVLLSFEASQVRTKYARLPNRLNNHYDLALAYLF